MPVNPNHTAKARSQLAPKGGDDNEDAAEGSADHRKGKDDISQLSRREREAIAVQQERDRYMKLHAEGKTEQARADLARLALVRERREADRARKETEREEKAEADKAKAQQKEREERQRREALGNGKKGKPKKK